MTLWFQLFILGSGWILLPILYGFLRMEVGEKKPAVIGIVIPEEVRKAPQVLEIIALYRRALKRCVWFAALFPVAFCWSRSMTFYMAMYMFWIFLTVFLFMVPPARYGERLKKLKYQNGWGSRTDMTGASGFDPGVSPVRPADKKRSVCFLILSMLPVPGALLMDCAAEEKISRLLLLLALSGTVWILTAMLWWMDRQKDEAVSRDPEENRNFNQDKKRLRAVSWNWISALSALLVWAAFVGLQNDFEPEAGWIAGLLVYTAAVIVLAIGCEWKILRMRKEKAVWLDGYDSEERYWYFGTMLYYNPDDRRFAVERRIGSGYSMNMASAGGKISAVLLILLLLFCLAGIPVMVGREEFTPVSLRMENDTLYALHTGTEYEIKTEEITDVVLLEQLPELSRKNGTGLPNLSKGRFRTDDRENRWLCLDPRNQLFLQVTTEEGNVYLFSDRTDEGTEKIWRELTEETK